MIVYRLVKGSPLTIAEFDGNFHDVDDRITSIEDNPPEARSIEDIIAIGSSLLIQYNDSTEDGPFPLPVLALRGRGDWAPSTSYLINDAVQANGIVYVVQYVHTSDLTFDAGKNDGEGHDAYGPLFSLPELVLPPGGGDGFVLSKNSTADFDMQWQARGIPDGGTAGYVLTKLSNDDLDVDWVNPIEVAATEEISSTTFEVDLNSANKYYRCTNASGCTITIPSDDEVAWPTDLEFTVRQSNNLSVLIVGGSTSDLDVIVNQPRPGYDTETPYEGAVVTIKRVGATEWDDAWHS